MVKKKEKINIAGEKYKVEEPVAKTLKALSDALHAHEVALLTWAHKMYHCDLEEDDKEAFLSSFYDYCLKIPESGKILKKMKELDKKYEEERKKELEEKDKNNKSQNKEEKVKGAKE